VELRRRGQHPWLLYYTKRAADVVPDEPPTMSAWQRLYPSGLVTIITIAGSVLLAALYVPPNFRLMPEVPPAAATILSIIAINSLVLLAWRIPPLWAFLDKYMMVVPGYPRGAAILGSTFSHQNMVHFAPNMFFIWFFGTRLHDQIGRGDFLAVYLSTGAIAAFFSMCCHVFRGVLTSSHLGASGAVCGIMGAYCWMNKDEELPISFLEGYTFPKYSTLVFMGITTYLEFRTLHRVKKGLMARLLTDHYAHLAGWGSGIAAGELCRRRIEAHQKEKQMQGILMMKNSSRQHVST